MQTADFAAGLARLERIARRRPTAIMCAEAVPWRCHRSLIADALTVAGWRVLHIQSRRTARPHRRTPFLRVRGGTLRYPAPPRSIDGKSHRLPAVALALLFLGLWPHDLHAQAFIASRPHPEFGIGPLFLSVSVGKDDVRPAHRPVTVTVTWNLALPERGAAADMAQDLYLLWPGEVPGAAGDEGADRQLLAQVGALGFRSKESGRLRLSGVRRSDLGSGVESRPLGEAPFVTFGDGGAVRGPTGATVIRIRWVSELGSPDWLVRLQIPVRDVIVQRPVTWIEDLFWGRWYVVRLAFGDLESLALYPFYFGVRDRVVPVAGDFSTLLIDFADARRLRVDVTVPASALRRQGERDDDRATISIALAPYRGLLSQLLKVDFTYAPQRLPARPRGPSSSPPSSWSWEAPCAGCSPR